MFTVSPEKFRRPPQEELEELPLAQERERAERYRSVYTSLGLRVIAHKDGTLELTWRVGKALAKYALHQDARRRQRLHHLRPQRGRGGEPARPREEGVRPALRRRSGRDTRAGLLGFRRPEDGLPELRWLALRDVRQRPPLPRPLCEGPRPGWGRSSERRDRGRDQEDRALRRRLLPSEHGTAGVRL